MFKSTPDLKKHFQYIEASNAAFKKMNRNRKKVQIAKDVLMQIGKRFHANSTYFTSISVEEKVDYALEENTGDMEYRELLKRMPSCNVCARGSVFIAVVDRLDNLTLGKIVRGGGADDADMMTDYLKDMKIFTETELWHLECAFEMHSKVIPAESRGSGNTRMKYVMELIIKSKGVIDGDTFAPLIAVPPRIS